MSEHRAAYRRGTPGYRGPRPAARPAVRLPSGVGSARPGVTPYLQVDLKPVSPLRLPRSGTPDGMLRVEHGIADRMIHCAGRPVRVRSWHAGSDGTIRMRAEALVGAPDTPPAQREHLEMAIERMRFVFGIDDDMSSFFARFKRDPLIGPPIHRKPWYRPRRRPSPWEAVAWAITAQLIEAKRASVIQRRMVRRWGPRIPRPGDESHGRPAGRARGWNPPLMDMPSAELIAGRAPAELAAMDLAPKRALAMIQVAREIANGWTDPSDPAHDRRLMAIANIGPWTCQVLGLEGRGDPDSLPAGDLAYVKVVGHLAGLGRRATVEEVEAFYAPYEPYRGLAGVFTLIGGYGVHAKSRAYKPAA